MKMIPISSVRSLASSMALSLSTTLSISSSLMISLARFMVSFLMCLPPCPLKIEPREFIAFCRSSMLPPPTIFTLGFTDWTFISTSLLSKMPLRSMVLNFSLVSLALSSSFTFKEGRRRSRRRDSTLLSTSLSLALAISSLTMATAVAIRSFTIDSTSLPTYPTSVYFVASTLMKGASASFAILLAISVFPTPVEPIIRIFFGLTSSLISLLSLFLLTLLRRATAMVLFASFCPITYLSKLDTISFGVMSSSFLWESSSIFSLPLLQK